MDSLPLINSILFSVLILFKDVTSFTLTASKSANKAILGDNAFTISCAYTLTGSEQLFTIELQRKRDTVNSEAFETILTFQSPSNALNFTYQDTTLEDRTVATKPTEESKTATLVFNRIVCDDKSTYKCKALYAGSGVRTAESSVSVVVRANTLFEKDKIISYVPSASLEEGDDVTFQCSGDVGNEPVGDLGWFYYLNNDTLISINASDTAVSQAPVYQPGTCSYKRTSTLQLKMLRSFNNILVQCTVQQDNYNQFGDGHAQTTKIQVYYPPKVTAIADKTVDEGTDLLTFNCVADANPPPKYSWLLPNGTVSDGQSLSLTNLKVGDNGTYTCLVYNVYKQVNHSANETVYIDVRLKMAEEADKVYDFKILEAPNDNYTLMRISWKAPTVIAGDIIKEYRLIYYRYGDSPTEKTFLHQLNSTNEYSILVDVIPERTYSFEVYAIDILNKKGESITEVRQAPAGVPLNVEKNLFVTVQVISSLHSNANDRGKTRLAVTVVQKFFEETTYGTVRANGIIACVHVCKLSGVKTLLDFNTMANWKQAKDSRLTQYRITSPSWMDSLKTDQMNVTDVTRLRYTVGNDNCKTVLPGHYCNGPLTPGTGYILVAVSCTNGGCLLSKEYGPFFTVEDTAAAEIESENVAVIVGVVFGVIIVILALYASYVSMVLRGYRSKEAQSDVKKRRMRKGPIYANESFLTSSDVRTVGTLSNQTTATSINIESEYLRLDENTRDDKKTYDSIQNI